MTGQSHVGAVTVYAGSDPAEITTRTWEQDGRGCAVLRLGDAATLYLQDSSPEWLRALATAATELADWREQQGGGDPS